VARYAIAGTEHLTGYDIPLHGIQEAPGDMRYH